MKKIIIYSTLLLVGLSLSACNGKGKTATSSSSTKTTETTSKKSASTNSSKTINTPSSETKASSTVTTETKTNQSQSEKTPQKNQAETVLQQLTTSFPTDPLPQAILTSKTPGYLSAATTKASDQANFRILYYAENQAISVNDIALNDLQPIALFEKQTYSSADEAANKVAQVIDTSGNPIDLGYGITGHQQGAAGSSYLSWQEGNWSLVVRASNIEGEVGEPLAKEVVAYLETAMLPAPQNVGQISLAAGISDFYQSNSVVWQQGATVYTIQHFDPLQAVKMAVSTNK